DEVTSSWFDGLPFIRDIISTSYGRFAIIVLPRFGADLYSDPAALVQEIDEGLHLARTVGARVVSLTGLIPSATDYGRSILPMLAEHPELPPISTGHATTTASVVLSIRRILEEAGRAAAGERVGFLGLGSIGAASLRLMLRCLPHPAEIALCDIY